MSDSNPRFPEELLADLHAGVLPPDVEAELWPQVLADPEASAVIDALDRVSSTLGDLGSAGLSAHGEHMPADLANQLDALFAARETPGDQSPSANVLPLRPRESSRHKRQWQWLAAACALVAMVGAASIWIGTADRSNDSVQAVPTSTPATSPLVLEGELDADILVAAMGHNDAQGRLSHDGRLRECLNAVGIPAGRGVLGSTSVVFEQRPGVLVLVAGPTEDTITALIVSPECPTGSPDDVYAQKDI